MACQCYEAQLDAASDVKYLSLLTTQAKKSPKVCAVFLSRSSRYYAREICVCQSPLLSPLGSLVTLLRC